MPQNDLNMGTEQGRFLVFLWLPVPSAAPYRLAWGNMIPAPMVPYKYLLQIQYANNINELTA